MHSHVASRYASVLGLFDLLSARENFITTPQRNKGKFLRPEGLFLLPLLLKGLRCGRAVENDFFYFLFFNRAVAATNDLVMKNTDGGRSISHALSRGATSKSTDGIIRIPICSSRRVHS